MQTVIGAYRAPVPRVLLPVFPTKREKKSSRPSRSRPAWTQATHMQTGRQNRHFRSCKLPALTFSCDTSANLFKRLSPRSRSSFASLSSSSNLELKSYKQASMYISINQFASPFMISTRLRTLRYPKSSRCSPLLYRGLQTFCHN